MNLFYKLYFYLNNLVRLSFEDLEKEKKFQLDFERDHIKQNKIAIHVGLYAHLLFFPIAYFQTPEDFYLLILVDSFFPIAISLFFLLKIHSNNFQKQMQFKLFVFAMGIISGFFIMINVTTLYYEMYIINSMLPLFALYVMFGAAFISAFLAASLLLIGMSISILFIDIDSDFQVYYIFLLSITYVFSTISGYLIEKHQRRLYFLTYKQEELNKEILKKEKLLQEQSRLAQMGEMISMIAHQWRQPLGAISSAVIGINIKLESNQFDFEDADDRKKFLEYFHQKHTNITNYVNILSSTIDDFRNFFKPDKESEFISLVSPIHKALSIIKSSLYSHNITLTLSYKVDDTIEMYQNEMMQVILNILKNSEDNFLEKKIENPNITIETSKDNYFYIIIIEDNGGGIKENLLSKIFDPYFSTKKETNGTGIGLYMSKIMIEEHHHGILSVENIYNKNQTGIRFKILLKRDHAKHI